MAKPPLTPSGMVVGRPGPRGPAGPAGLPGAPGQLPIQWAYPEAHGATGNGTANDYTALNDAMTALASAGGGILWLSGTYGWKGVLSIPDGVALVGCAGNGAGRGRLVALDATSRLQSGSWTDNHNHPAALANITVDGNGHGDPTGLVWVESITTTYTAIQIKNAAGKGVVINGGQNNTFISCDTLGCGDDALTMTFGAGGNLFERCETWGTPSHALKVTEAGAGVYPYAPTHNVFRHCIFETAVNGVSLVDVEAASLLKFDDCAFSQNGTATLSSGYVFRVLNNPAFPGVATMVELVDPFFYGGAAGHQVDGIYIQGNNTLRVVGHAFFQNTPNVYSFDGIPLLSTLCTAEYVGTTTTYNPLGGSAAVNTIGPTLDAPVGVRQATSLQSAFRTARKADNGWRLWVNSDGGHTWGDGTTYVPAGPTLGYDATNGNLAVSGGLMRTGRRGDVAVSHNISTAGQATTCDTKAYSVHSFSLFANAGAVTLSNAVEGAEVTLIVAQDATGGRTFTWPTALYANNAAPADTGPNSVNIVALRYTSGGWIETWRRITHSWTNATVTGITTNPSGSGAPVGYTKINGVVYLRGLAASVAVNATLFTLPAGYRPPYQLTVPIFTMNGSAAITAGYLTVGADGTVRMPSGAGALVSFDGVTFPAEA